MDYIADKSNYLFSDLSYNCQNIMDSQWEKSCSLLFVYLWLRSKKVSHTMKLKLVITTKT